MRIDDTVGQYTVRRLYFKPKRNTGQNTTKLGNLSTVDGRQSLITGDSSILPGSEAPTTSVSI